MSNFQSKQIKKSYLDKFDHDECPWCAPKRLLKRVWWKLERLYRRLIGRKLHFLAKVLAYSKILYSDFDFDSCYLYPLMALKMKRLLKTMEEGHLEQDSTDLKALKLCIKLCERIREDGDYYDRPMRRHDRKWGKSVITWRKVGKKGSSMMNSRRKNAKTTRQKNRERKEFMASYRASDFLRDRDRRILFNVMAKYMPNWWE